MKKELMVIGLVFASFLALGVSSFKEDASCAVVSEEGVEWFDITLPPTRIPAAATFYVCQQFKLPIPDDQVYHMVAFEPLITSKAMHHMILFGCQEEVNASEPHRCDETQSKCTRWMAQWSMGVNGKICMYNDTGYRIGEGSFKQLHLQVHWNNDLLEKDIVDNSGFRVYYTRKLKKHDVGNVQIGQNDIELPPGSETVVSGGCSGFCTKNMLSQPIYLTRSHLHMHYLGTSAKLLHYRGEQLIKEILVSSSYDFENPGTEYHNPPVVILPGDEVRMTCVFNSRDGDRRRNQTAYWGMGAESEMCYAFVTYYPNVPDLFQCVQFAEHDTCLGAARGENIIGECNMGRYEWEIRSTIFPELLRACADPESADCTAKVESFHQNACMQDRVGLYVRRILFPSMNEWASLQTLIPSLR